MEEVMAKILVVDDEDKIRDLIKKYAINQRTTTMAISIAMCV